MMARVVVSLLLLAMLAVTFQNCAQGGFTAASQLTGDGSSSSFGNTNDNNVVYDDSDSIAIDASVHNAISTFKPALAVRGVSCIFCHAQVDSNIISDFAYSKIPAHNFFLNNHNPFVTNHYGDRKLGNEPSTLQVLKTDGNETFTVPRVQLPAQLQTSMGSTFLHEYVKSRLTSSVYPSSRTTKVEARDTVNISSISANRIREIFAADQSTPIKFQPSKGGSQTIEGLSFDPGNKFYSVNNTTFVCNGDLFIDGAFHLNSATISTSTGCRIHATQTIFINGGLKVVQATTGENKHNVQLMSSTAVLMGLGSLYRGNKYCDSAWYATNNDSSGQRIKNSLSFRISHFFNPAHGVSDSKQYTSTQLKDLILSDATKLPTVYDASCEAGGRNVNFERVLINAPLVMSRYNGNFKGSIVAELALMSLGQFKFSFDDVFTKVAPFPKFKSYEILDVQ